MKQVVESNLESPVARRGRPLSRLRGRGRGTAVGAAAAGRGAGRGAGVGTSRGRGQGRGVSSGSRRLARHQSMGGDNVWEGGSAAEPEAPPIHKVPHSCGAPMMTHTTQRRGLPVHGTDSCMRVLERDTVVANLTWRIFVQPTSIKAGSPGLMQFW